MNFRRDGKNWSYRLLQIIDCFDSFKSREFDGRSLMLSQQYRMDLTSFYNRKDSLQKPLDMKTVFANNYLNMNNINVIGFDLDYTLIQYTNELQHLIYKLSLDNLIRKFGYSTDLKNKFKYNDKFAIRGLSIDTKNGILCKLSHLQKVSAHGTYYGHNPMTNFGIKDLYGEARFVSNDHLKEMVPLYDLYTLVEACLIADFIEYYNQSFDIKNFNISWIINDIRSAVREIHINGILQQTILEETETYINHNSINNVVKLLEYYKSHDKKLFLCTNSNFLYTNTILSSLFGKDWKEKYFDVIICSANKPRFYTENASFRELNVLNNSLLARPIKKLEKGNVYTNGSAKLFHELTGNLMIKLLFDIYIYLGYYFRLEKS